MLTKGKGDWKDVCYADRVFKNSSKGEIPTDAELQEAFETSDVEEVMKTIALKGDLQTTSQDRAKAMADKKKQIINYIHKYYIDPKSKKPHPVVHIENAWDSSKLKVDLDKPVEEQVKQAYPKLLESIALKRCEIEGKLVVPHSHLGQAQGIIRKYCSVSGEVNIFFFLFLFLF